MSKNFIKSLLVLVVFAVLTVVYFRKQLQQPAFNLIDDGYSLSVSQQLHDEYSVENWRQTLVNQELEKGRLRPAYYLYYFVIFLFSQSALAFWTAQAICLLVLIFLIYLFFNSAGLPWWLSVTAAIPLFLLPSLADNFLRLGPAESRQLLWLLIAFLALLVPSKKQFQLIQYVTSIIFYLLALATKETTLIALPALLFLFTSRLKLQKRFWQLANVKKLFLPGGVVLLSLLFVILIPRSGYSSGLQFNVVEAKNNLFAARISFPEAYWVLALGAVSLIIRITDQKNIRFFFEPQFLFSQLLFLLAVPFLLVPLFWPYQLERYFLPGQLFAWMFLVIEMWFFWQFFRSKPEHDGVKFLIAYLFVIFGITRFIFITSFLNSEKFISRLIESKKLWYEQYQYSDVLIRYLENSIRPNEKIFVTHNDYEVIYEIGLYASQFKRREIQVWSENQQAAFAFGTSHQYTENAAQSFTQTTPPTVLIGRGENMNEYPSAQALLPFDSSLRDDKQTWFIVVK